MKLLTYLEFKQEWSPNEIPWGFSTVYANSSIKLGFYEWVDLMVAFNQLDSDSRLDAAIVSIKEENKIRYDF